MENLTSPQYPEQFDSASGRLGGREPAQATGAASRRPARSLRTRAKAREVRRRERHAAVCVAVASLARRKISARADRKLTRGAIGTASPCRAGRAALLTRPDPGDRQQIAADFFCWRAPSGDKKKILFIFFSSICFGVFFSFSPLWLATVAVGVRSQGVGVRGN